MVNTENSQLKGYVGLYNEKKEAGQSPLDSVHSLGLIREAINRVYVSAHIPTNQDAALWIRDSNKNAAEGKKHYLTWIQEELSSIPGGGAEGIIGEIDAEISTLDGVIVEISQMPVRSDHQDFD